jgi:hypothetical protein
MALIAPQLYTPINKNSNQLKHLSGNTSDYFSDSFWAPTTSWVPSLCTWNGVAWASDIKTILLEAIGVWHVNPMSITFKFVFDTGCDLDRIDYVVTSNTDQSDGGSFWTGPYTGGIEYTSTIDLTTFWEFVSPGATIKYFGIYNPGFSSEFLMTDLKITPVSDLTVPGVPFNLSLYLNGIQEEDCTFILEEDLTALLEEIYG